jgi:hypothetical protein
MTPTKRFLRSNPVQSASAWLIAMYIRLVYWTTRWSMTVPPEVEGLLAGGKPFVACFWHGRLSIMRVALPRQMPVYMLISEHPDGQMISRSVSYMGVRTVKASRKRGGITALRAMQRVLAKGGSIGITPDGPRGPRMRAKGGALKTAQLSGAPILPISGAVSRRLILSSWDRFCLPLPFGRGIILWGDAISVPRHATEEELEGLRLELETRLNALTAEADRRLGQPSVEPAALAPGKERANHARA